MIRAKTSDESQSYLEDVNGREKVSHLSPPKNARYWRTRKDPFEIVWPDILLWLQETPDSTPKELFERLQKNIPGSFPDGQLRTLQRRIRAWRQVMARNLIYGNLDAPELPSDVTPIGIDRTNFIR